MRAPGELLKLGTARGAHVSCKCNVERSVVVKLKATVAVETIHSKDVGDQFASHDSDMMLVKWSI